MLKTDAAKIIALTLAEIDGVDVPETGHWGNAKRFADTLEAAGHLQSRVIRTQEQWDELPEFTVVRLAAGGVAEKRSDGTFRMFNVVRAYEVKEELFPMTVMS